MHDVIVANGRWHGGGMKLAPDAMPDDGLFDVVLIGDVTKLDFADDGAEALLGPHVTHPRVEVLRSATVAVDAAEPLPIELEGETVGHDAGALRDRARRDARAHARLERCEPGDQLRRLERDVELRAVADAVELDPVGVAAATRRGSARPPDGQRQHAVGRAPDDPHRAVDPRGVEPPALASSA